MWQEIARFGKKLVDRGLVESHFGNISVRIDDRLLITRTGSALDEINENSIVEVDIDIPSSLDEIASKELVVHRAIYRNTPALAIIHAHPRFAVVESLLSDGLPIMPVDIEGRYLLQEIPIVGGEPGTDELAENTAGSLKDRSGVIVQGHGTFAIGSSLDEAYVITDLMEHSCRLKYLYDLAKK